MTRLRTERDAGQSQLARSVEAGDITSAQFEVESVRTLRRLKTRINWL